MKIKYLKVAWGIADAIRDRMAAIEQERGDDGKLTTLEILEHVAKGAMDAAEIYNDPKVTAVVNTVAGAALQVIAILGEPTDDTE